MGNKEEPKINPQQEFFSKKIGKLQQQKIRAQQHNIQTIWYGLGMMGLVGWSISIPTLIGIFIGLFLDRTFPSERSWTLIFIVIGLSLGCLNAWRWLRNEDRKIRKEQEHKDE